MFCPRKIITRKEAEKIYPTKGKEMNTLDYKGMIIQHVLDTERDDYLQWCKDTKSDPRDFEANQTFHIYALAAAWKGDKR